MDAWMDIQFGHIPFIWFNLFNKLAMTYDNCFDQRIPDAQTNEMYLSMKEKLWQRKVNEKMFGKC